MLKELLNLDATLKKLGENANQLSQLISYATKGIEPTEEGLEQYPGDFFDYYAEFLDRLDEPQLRKFERLLRSFINKQSIKNMDDLENLLVDTGYFFRRNPEYFLPSLIRAEVLISGMFRRRGIRQEITEAQLSNYFDSFSQSDLDVLSKKIPGLILLPSSYPEIYQTHPQFLEKMVALLLKNSPSFYFKIPSIKKYIVANEETMAYQTLMKQPEEFLNLNLADQFPDFYDITEDLTPSLKIAQQLLLDFDRDPENFYFNLKNYVYKNPTEYNNPKIRAQLFSQLDNVLERPPWNILSVNEGKDFLEEAAQRLIEANDYKRFFQLIKMIKDSDSMLLNDMGTQLAKKIQGENPSLFTELDLGKLYPRLVHPEYYAGRKVKINVGTLENPKYKEGWITLYLPLINKIKVSFQDGSSLTTKPDAPNLELLYDQ